MDPAQPSRLQEVQAARRLSRAKLPMRRALALIGVVAAAAVAVPASGASTSSGVPYGAKKRATVKVADDYFSSSELQVKKNAKVNFKWLSSNTDSHNVTLQRGPKGVKKGCSTKGKDAYSPLISKCNVSSTGAVGIKFKKKFDKPGTYSFICTIHPTTMQLTVDVKK